jgi:hypothetical protein
MASPSLSYPAPPSCQARKRARYLDPRSTHARKLRYRRTVVLTRGVQVGSEIPHTVWRVDIPPQRTFYLAPVSVQVFAPRNTPSQSPS